MVKAMISDQWVEESIVYVDVCVLLKISRSLLLFKFIK